ncbi:MAG: TolC family protein [Tannerellaceae bacterium]|nr:TolC family protein [Tannerellaceae bacterium]MCD8263998.1 TolC family protein [Tannerellaceae bacterium]
MRLYSYLTLSLLLLLPGIIQAQDKPDVWTLQDCLDYALEYNIQLNKNRITYLSGQEDVAQAKAQLFPSLSGSVLQGYTHYPSGRVETNHSYSGNYSVNANWTVFDWSRRTNNLKQQKILSEVDELNVEQSEYDILLSLVQTYMQVLYAFEAIRITENTVEVSEAERDRAQELLAAGAISRVELAQLESQYASDKYQLIVAQTNFENYKLQLKQLLELDIEEDMVIAIPELTEEDVLSPLPEKNIVYTTSLAVMPSIRGSLLNLEVAELDIKKARAGYFPTLSLNAAISTGHLSGTNYNFGNLLWDRFNETVGLTVSIPIFTNRETKTAVNKAKLALTNSQLDLLNSQNQLLRTIEGIYLDATSAQNQYLAASERLSYVAESYDLTQQQFFLGMKNTVELLTEKNNYLSSQQELLQSKYMAIMSRELLNVYQNKAVDLDY